MYVSTPHKKCQENRKNVIHYTTSRQNHPPTPSPTQHGVASTFSPRDNHLSSKSRFGWSTTSREWKACTRLNCTFLWVICIFTCRRNRPDDSLSLWINRSAKYARVCQNLGLNRTRRDSLLHRVKLEELIVDYERRMELWEIFLPKQTGWGGNRSLCFPFSLEMFCSSDICMFQCPLSINEYAVMVLSYAACRGEYIY